VGVVNPNVLDAMQRASALTVEQVIEGADGVVVVFAL
jgi:hypothetical protein